VSESDIEQDLVENDGSDYNDSQILHRAVSIIRRDREKLQRTTEYPNTQEIDLNASAAFVPDSLKSTLQWLIDKQAFDSADQDYKSTETTRCRYISLAECLIYCSRRGKSQVIPPFHVGLMTQLHHEYGSRNLIDIINSYGMCASYDELRIFQTAAAEDQISTAEDGVYVPPGLLPWASGGSLIQEGDDNGGHFVYVI